MIEASSHTATASRRLAGTLGIDLLWLPKCSPHFNPMDHLWRQANKVVSAHQWYGPLDDHVDRFIAYLLSLAVHDAMRKAGILSENFWLR